MNLVFYNRHSNEIIEYRNHSSAEFDYHLNSEDLAQAAIDLSMEKERILRSKVKKELEK